MQGIDTIGYSRFDDLSKQQDMVDERSQLIKGLEMQQTIASKVADGTIGGEVAEQAASQYKQVLDQQVKLRAQASWDYRKKMVPLRAGLLSLNQWDAYEAWKQPQLSGNAFERNRGSGSLFALADTHWLDAVCEAVGQTYFNRILWELPYRSSMRSIGAVRVCFVSFGKVKNKCDAMGRPSGTRAPTEKALQAACEALGVRKENFRSVDLQGAAMLSLTARSHLELADLIILTSSAVHDMAGCLAESGLGKQIIERHRLGASIVAIGAAVALLSILDLCPFVITTDDHSSSDKEKLSPLVAVRPTAELRPRAALVINTDGITEPIGGVQLQNVNQPPQGMPNPPNETGMRIAYERWAQTWSSDHLDQLPEAHVFVVEVPAVPETATAHGPSTAGSTVSHIRLDYVKAKAKAAAKTKVEGNSTFKSGHAMQPVGISNRQYAAAITLYQQAAASDPTCQGAHLNLAACYLKDVTLDPLQALLAANRVLHLTHGRSAKAFFRRGLAFELMEDFLNAYHDFKEAKRLAPDDTVLREKCKQYYQQSIDNPNEMTGDFQSAKESYFYDHYQVLNPAYDDWEARDEEVAVIDRNCRFLSARALWLWDKLLRGYSEASTLRGATIHKRSSLRNLTIHLNLGADGVSFLCEGLRDNKNLRHLSIRGCFIRTEGAQAMKNAIVSNTTLTSLDIGQNAIHDEGLRQMALGIAENKSLTKLDLSNNGLECIDELPAGLKQLCETLLVHPTLKHLDLSHNNFGEIGGAALFETIQYNMGLTSLKLIQMDFEAHMVARLVGITIDHESLHMVDLRENSVCVCTSTFAEERLAVATDKLKTIQLGAVEAEDLVGAASESVDENIGAIVPSHKLDFHSEFPWEEFANELY